MEFETKFIEFVKEKRDVVHEDDLTELEGSLLGVDAQTLLLMAAREANPFKSLQEGHSAVDVDL